MELIKKILVPIDFSDYSKKALHYTVAFAKQFNAEINLVYVIEPVVYPADLSMGQVVIPQSEIDLSSKSKQELEQLAKTEIGNLLKYNIIIKNGKPFVEIIETATEIDSDLIIISTHGHTGVEHLLFGSTAEKVVRKAPCPVLTIREPIKGFRFKA
ncbi:MAG: stress protein UspA [Ignavibacteriales bacterium CG18_big_fil_WC_8_21_14_2_50_31_20]|nr:MAG: stress protein UspA [Ignavibacteriales bacterium CG18_big_fil_WC_8_21_14_2_50_31_20]